MRGERLELRPIIAEADLHAALEAMLGRRVASLARRVSQYSSSTLVEELDVTLDDGTTLALLLKDLSPSARLGGAVKVRPHFIYDPLREIETYRRILSRHDIGAPHFYGAVVEPERERYWLLIERVEPVLLWQQGELASWTRVAAWLAGMHGHFQTSVSEAGAAHLLRHDRDFYWTWMQRAGLHVSQGDTAPGRPSAKAVAWLASRYEPVFERLCTQPATIIHGEFVASNVMLGANGRVCPVDWELAAVGPGVVDLAAMSAGAWSREGKDAMALAYFDAMPAAGLAQPPRDEFLTALECARLCQAVQWLGWAPGWEPPPEHAQDWLRDALESAHILEL